MLFKGCLDVVNLLILFLLFFSCVSFVLEEVAMAVNRRVSPQLGYAAYLSQARRQAALRSSCSSVEGGDSLLSRAVTRDLLHRQTV